MGSIEKANITGFLCRLCSEMHRVVIHIYGDQGKKQSLVDKINGYLPITVRNSPYILHRLQQKVNHKMAFSRRFLQQILFQRPFAKHA